MENIKPQLENGFIQIATGDQKNDILMALIKQRLNATQYQIVLLVIRKTWGFKKSEDWISLTQFENYLSKNRTTVCREIKQLVAKKILVAKTTPGVRAIYSLNKDFEQWKQLVAKTPLVAKTHRTSGENAHKLVAKTPPTKETITKETIQKKNIVKKNSDNSSLPELVIITPKNNRLFMIPKAERTPKCKMCGHCSHCSLSPATEDELYSLALKLNIKLSDVKRKHNQIMEMIESGEFQKKYKHATVWFTLRKWLNMAIERNYIQEMNEIERMSLQSDSPEKIKQREEAFYKLEHGEMPWTLKNS